MMVCKARLLNVGWSAHWTLDYGGEWLLGNTPLKAIKYLIGVYAMSIVRVITDLEIEGYVQERKYLPQNYRTPTLRNINGHGRAKFSVEGERGNSYQIDIRVNQRNPLDFSIIFSVILAGNEFRLRRYNGNHPSPHTNKLEGNRIRSFHIHKATERYQTNGFKEEAFAEITTRYYDWNTALNACYNDNNILERPHPNQTELRFGDYERN